MSRYIVQPMVGLRGIPYYVVTDTATGKGLEGYGCDTWAQKHRADASNHAVGPRRPVKTKGKQHV